MILAALVLADAVFVTVIIGFFALTWGFVCLVEAVRS